MRDLEVEFPAPCGELWESMAPAGCNRLCAACDKTIHDLEKYRFDEVAALLVSGEEVCVRARISRDGAIALKTGAAKTGRILLAASAGMLAFASPAYGEMSGKIIGKVDGHRVTATDANGRSFRAVLRQDGRFWFNKLPPGDYVVSAHGCVEPWTVGKVSVRGGKVVLPPSFDPKADECIIVGVMARTQKGG